MPQTIDYEVSDLGINHPQYFQGLGISFTDYEHCVVGIGDTFNEALNDAIEMMSQYGHGLKTEQFDEIYLNERINEKDNERTSAMKEMRIDVSNEVTPFKYIDMDCDHEKGEYCEDCHNATVDDILESIEDHQQYYVGIRYNLVDGE